MFGMWWCNFLIIEVILSICSVTVVFIVMVSLVCVPCSCNLCITDCVNTDSTEQVCVQILLSNKFLFYCAGDRLDGRRHNVLICPFILLFNHYQTCEHIVLKTNEPVLMQIGTSGLQVMVMKRSSLGVRRSKVKVIRRWNESQKSFSTRNYTTNFNQALTEAHLMVDVHLSQWPRFRRSRSHAAEVRFGSLVDASL